MQTHGTGKIVGTRQGSYPTIHSIPVDPLLNLTAVPNKFLTIEATPGQPAAYRVSLLIETAAVGTTASIIVGVASGGTTILNGSDLKAAAGTEYPATTDRVPLRTTQANVDLWFTPTLVAITAGRAFLIVEVWELNVKQATTQGD